MSRTVHINRRASHDLAEAESDVRELLYRRGRFVYRIYYRIAGDEVFVHRNGEKRHLCPFNARHPCPCAIHL